MKEPLGAHAGPGLSFSMDRVAMNIHSNADSHIDALCHVIFDCQLYNGRPRTRSPILGCRAVDRRRGRRRRRPRGAIVCVRSVRRRPNAALGCRRGPGRAAPALLPLAAESQIAALGSDGNSDTAPSVADGVDFPVHALAINAVGLHLMDYLEFGELAPLCEREGCRSVLCVIAPRRLPTGTGSPVT